MTFWDFSLFINTFEFIRRVNDDAVAYTNWSAHVERSEGLKRMNEKPAGIRNSASTRLSDIVYLTQDISEVFKLRPRVSYTENNKTEIFGYAGSTYSRLTKFNVKSF
jgi:hypothetical protein